MNIESYSEKNTITAATDLAKQIKNGDILLFEGPLGAGKSVFARALIRALCANPDLEVPSPTFTLVQYYDSNKGPLYHFDLYRIEDTEEIFEIGWEEALSDGILLIEWPNRLNFLRDNLPSDRVWEIEITPEKESHSIRRITISH